MRKKDRISKSVIFADFVGLTYVIAANIILLLGAYTKFVPGRIGVNRGIDFVYNYFTYPFSVGIRSLIEAAMPQGELDPIGQYLCVELTILISGVTYGAAAYLTIRLLTVLFK